MKKIIIILFFTIVLIKGSGNAALVLMESYNVDVADALIIDSTIAPYYVPDGAQISLKYIPTTNYFLSRVEFYSGSIYGPDTLTYSIRQNVETVIDINQDGEFDDIPSIDFITKGTSLYNHSNSYDWIGVNFENPFEVISGNPYWITWENYKNFYFSFSTGIPRTVLLNLFDNVFTYNSALFTDYGFKTKFYSDINPDNNPIPEPASLVLFGISLMGLGIFKLIKWKNYRII